MAIRLQRAQLESMSRSCNSLRFAITRQLYAQDPTSWQHNPKKKKNRKQILWISDHPGWFMGVAFWNCQNYQTRVLVTAQL